MIESMVTMPAIALSPLRQIRNPSVLVWLNRVRYAWKSSRVAGMAYHGWCSATLARASAVNSSWSLAASGRNLTRAGPCAGPPPPASSFPAMLNDNALPPRSPETGTIITRPASLSGPG